MANRSNIIRLFSFVVAGLLGFSVFSNVFASEPNLLAHWNFEEGSGATTADTAGTGNDLDIQGATWGADRGGGTALVFNGTNDYATRTSELFGGFPAESSDYAEDFTLAAWIKLDSGNTRRPIISKQSSGNRGFNFAVEPGNNLALEVYKNSVNNSPRSAVSSSQLINVGTWYHVAATYDYIADGSSELRLYINGIEDGVRLSAVGPILGNSYPIEIGRYYWNGSYNWYFDGTIDEVRVYDRALTQTEIDALYQGSATPTPTPSPGVTPTPTPSPSPTPTPTPPSQQDWWNSNWEYRMPIDVGVGPYERLDKPADLDVNFTDALSSLGVGEAFDENSIRIIEVDGGGGVVDADVPFQFDKASNYDSSTNAQGTLVFMLTGMTPAGSTRYYHIYFDVVGKSFTLPDISPQITLTDGVQYQGEESYKIISQNATYYYHKAGAGFASMEDINGVDWISYNSGAGSGSAGEYRGIPNMPDFGHPGGGTSYGGQYAGSSSIVNQGPIKLTIKSVRNDDAAEILWEVYPNYIKNTVVKMPNSYIWGYEGTPGGVVEATSDYRTYSDATQITLNNLSNTDLPNPEWLYFGDPATTQKIFLANHQNEDFVDEYWTMNGEMTVFGFGRDGSNYQLNTFPGYFTFGFVDAADYGEAAADIESSYQDLNLAAGSAQSKGFLFQRSDWTNTPGGVGAVRIGDMDNDGDNDIVGLGGRNLFVFENLGGGNWNPAPDNCLTTSGCTVGPYYDLDSTGQAGLNGMAIYDVDGDGDLDVIGAKYYKDLGWWENPGPPIGTAVWAFHPFYSTTRYLHDLELVDLDGDGNKQEIIVNLNSGYWNADIEVLWFRVGVGPSGPLGTWTAHTIAPPFSEGSDHGHAGLGVGDIDADGDIDVSFANGWFEAPTDPTGSWTFREITSIYGMSNNIPGDMDNDGDLDLVMSAGHHGQGVYWFENTGTPLDDGSWIMHQLHATAGDIYSRYYYDAADEGITVIHPEGLNVLDIDFDGDLDVMATEIFFGEDPGEPLWESKSHNIYLFENKGGKPVDASGWIRYNLSPDSWPNHSIRAVDLNEDGLMDIITEGPRINNISYLENVTSVSPQPTPTPSPTPTPTPVPNIAPDGVIDTPPGDFSVETGGSVSFSGTATDPDNNLPLTHLWTFGGATPDSVLEDPGLIQFNTAGVYTITYTVTDSLGLSDPTPASVNIAVSDPIAPPVAEFSADVISGETPLTVNFSDLSSNTPDIWEWDFENDSVVDSNIQNPTFIYNNPGTYSVRFAASNSAGTDVEIKVDYIIVSPPNQAPESVIDTPTADLDINIGDSVSFSGSATDPDNNLPLNHLWTFDGAMPNSTLEDPGLIQFDTSGTFNITYTATDSLGLSDPTPAVVQVRVNKAPFVYAGLDQELTLPQDTLLLGGSAGDDGLPLGSTLTYIWTQESGPATILIESPNSLSTNTTFSQEGIYVLRLTADDTALSSYDEVTVTVTTQPLYMGYLLAHWEFEEGFGTQASDSSTNGNTMTVSEGSGVTWTTVGKRGGGLAFDGVNRGVDYAYINDSDLVGEFPAVSSNATDDFTVAAWVKFDNLNGRKPIILKQGDGQRGLMLAVQDYNGQDQLWVELWESASSGSSYSSSVLFEVGKWYFVAVSYDHEPDPAIGSSVKLYVIAEDNLANPNISANTTPVDFGGVGGLNPNTDPLQLGRYTWFGYSVKTDGTIDDVRLFNFSLSDQNIIELAGL